MATEPEDIKKKIEAIAGREINVETEQLKSLWYPAAAYDYSDGYINWQHIFLPGMRCDNARLLDASGASYTDASGRRVFRLSQFVCLPQYRFLSEPVNLLATPRSKDPYYVTAVHLLLDESDFLRSDVEIAIFGWDRNGAPAPELPFHWRCRVHLGTPVL
jgi:hypothetical protein